MNKTVIYTALFGDNDRLYPQPKIKGTDFICFSDREQNVKGWKVIKVDAPFGSDNTRNNRYFKILPHLSLKEYQHSIYMDANIIILKSPLKLIETGMSDYNMLVFDHNQTIRDPRNCIYEEYQAILDLGKKNGVYKDDPVIMEKQMTFFKSKGYPQNHGLMTGGVLIRKHNEADVIQTMERWWYFIKNSSKRDQLSFNYAAWETGFKFKYLTGDIRRGNPWFHMLSKHNKSLSHNMLKYRLRKLWKMIFTRERDFI